MGIRYGSVHDWFQCRTYDPECSSDKRSKTALFGHPLCSVALGAVIFTKYPLTKKRYDEMRAIVDKKNKGEQYDLEAMDGLVKVG